MKSFPKKINIGEKFRELFTPSNPDTMTETITGEYTHIAEVQSQMMMAMLTGKSNDGKNMGIAESGAKKIKHSLLGEKDSIYTFLEEIKNNILTTESFDKKMQNYLPIFSTLHLANLQAFATEVFGDNNNYNVIQLLDNISGAVNKIPSILTVLNTIKDGIKIEIDNNILKELKNTNNTQVNSSDLAIKMIVEGLDGKTIDALQNFANINIKNLEETNQGIKNFIDILVSVSNNSKEISEHIDEYVKTTGESLDKLEAHFQRLIDLSQLAERAKEANKSIQEAMDSTNTVVSNTTNIQNDVKKANITINDLSSFVMTSAIVMSIGALFVMLGGGKFIENALLFGVTLGLFEITVIAPILAFGYIAKESLKAIGEFNKFIVTCAMVMSIGALFVSLSGGALVKNALAFGIALMAFEAMVIVPILLFKNLSGDLFKNLHQFTSFVVTCAMVMSIGALFVSLSGGALVKNALAFGLILMTFEALVIAPFLLFSFIDNKIFESAKHFTSIVIVCTTVMLIGALFVGLSGGALVKNALAFGLILMAFEALIIAPFLLFKFLEPVILSGLKDFTTTVIVCTTIMLVGALFVTLGGGKFIKNALTFALLLMAFEALVIAPFLLFNLIQPVVFKGLKDFTLVLTTSAVILLVGALFMTMNGGKFAIGALKFVALLDAFIISTALIFDFINKKGIGINKSIKEYEIFISVMAGILITGSIFVDKYGIIKAIKFATLLSGFTLAMAFVFTLVSDIMGDRKDIQKVREYEILLGILHGILITGSIFIDKYGFLSALGYAFTMATFTLAMVDIFKLIENGVDKKTRDTVMIYAMLVGVLHAVLLTGALFIEHYGAEGAVAVGAYALIMGLFTRGMVGIFKLVKNGVDKKTRDTVMAYAMLVGVLHAILLSGALFIEYYGSDGVLGYTVLMGLFTLAMVGIFRLIGGGIDKKTRDSVLVFTLLVGTLHAVIVTGAWFVEYYGSDGVLEYAALLAGFIVGVGVVFRLVSMIINQQTIPNIIMFCAAVGILHVILLSAIWFMNKYGGDNVQENVMAYTKALLLMTGGMGVIFALLGKLKDKIYPGILVAIGISIGIGVLGTVLAYVVWLFKEYESTTIFNCLKYLGAAVIEFGVLFGILGAPGINLAVALGSAVALAISVGIGIFGTVLYYVVNLLKDLDPKNITKSIGYLKNAAEEFGVLFGIIGIPPFAALITAGSIAAIAMGAAVNDFGTALGTVVGIFDKYSWDSILSCFGYLGLATAEFSALFTAIGVLSPIIVAGSAAASSIGYALTVFGNAIDVMMKIIDNYGGDNILESIDTMKSVFGNLAIMLGIIGNPIFTGIVILSQVNSQLLRITISTVTTAIKETLENFEKIGDIDTGVDNIITNVCKFFSIPYEIFKKLDIKGTLALLVLPGLTWAASEISTLLGETGEGVYKMASLLIPNRWDSEGKPIHYRQLRDSDFDLAAENTGKVLGTVIKSLVDIWEGTGDDPITINGQTGLKELYKNNDNPLKHILELSTEVSQLIGTVGENVGNIAKMQIPIEWNKDGKAIRFRTLKEKDFQMAASGTTTILTHMFSTLMDIYALGWNEQYGSKDGQNIFDMGSKGFLGIGETPSPLQSVLESSFKISELIGNIGTGVANIAKLQIPIAWDKKGKVTQYRTLKEKDFNDMGKGIKTILTTIFTKMIEIYHQDENLFQRATAGFLGEITGETKESPLEVVLAASMNVSKLIAGIGQGISQMATMQIPNKWDPKTGTATHFVKLKEKDFKEAGVSVGMIVTSVVNALKNYANDPAFESGNFKKIIENISPISELISGMADSIINLASGQVAKNWNKQTGVPIEYEKIEPQDYLHATENIGNIVTCVAEALIQLAEDKKDYFFDDNGNPSEKLQHVIESVTGVTGIVTGITDSIIKIGQGIVPDVTSWDAEKQQFTRYKKIDYVDAIVDTNNVIGQVIPALANALVNVVANHPNFFSENKDSEISLAIESITSVTKVATDIIDNIIKIGTCQIPIDWDDNGKPKRWKDINVDTVIFNVKKVFNDTIAGFINSIASLSYNTWDTADGIKTTKQLLTDFSGFKESIEDIIDIFSQLTNAIILISEAKIPTGFNAKGEPKGYSQLEKNNINKAQENIQLIINGIFGIFSSNGQNSIIGITSDTTISDNIKIINLLTNKVFDVIGSIMGHVTEIVDYMSDTNELFNYKRKSQKVEGVNELGIGIFDDIYTIFNSIQSIASLLFSPANKKTMNEIVTTINDDSYKNNINIALSNLNIIISSIINNVSNLYDSYIENSNNLDALFKDQITVGDKSVPKLTYMVNKSFELYKNIIHLLNDNLSFINFDSLLDDWKKMPLFMIDINRVIANIFTNMISLNDNFNNSIENINELLNKKIQINKHAAEYVILNKIKSVFDIYENIINVFKEKAESQSLATINFSDLMFVKSIGPLTLILSSVFDSAEKLSQINTQFEIHQEEILGKLRSVLSIYTSISTELLKNINDESIQKLYQLDESLNVISKTLSNQNDNNKTLNNNTIALSKYIKAINTVDVNKVKPLTSLVAELNKLSDKLGGLDRLTESLTNDLAMVLNKLVASLEESKETIHSANDLQDKRHKEINSSIKIVSELFKMPLNVNISADGSNVNTTIPNDVDNPNNQNGQLNGGNNQGGGEDKKKEKIELKKSRKTLPSTKKGASIGTTNQTVTK